MSAGFTAILDLTERVQAAIDAGDWPRAQELETERRDALERLVAEQAMTGEVQSVLGELYARNLRMIGEVQHHRRRMLRDAALVKTGRDAVAAYGAEPGSSIR